MSSANLRSILFLTDQGDELQVITWVVIPLVLVIAISLTVFVFYRKGNLYFILKYDGRMCAEHSIAVWHRSN